MIADLLIRDGTIYDGSGGQPYHADILVDKGSIVHIGALPDRVEARHQLDARGLAVSPGFIDIHSHSDFTLLVDPRAVSAVHQGVTLEVIGNCGHGCFPINNPDLAATAIYGHTDSVPISWQSADGYFHRLEEAAPAVNVISLVPNGQLRLSVIGLEERPARPAELVTMGRRLEKAMDEGAWGLSSGLEYAAESGASEDELQALCRIVARRGGFYATHTRKRDAGALDAVRESLDTAAASGVRLQISHLLPRNGADAGRECISAVESAAGRGADLAFDMHTRLFGFTYLAALLPASAMSLEPSGLAQLLGDHAARSKLRHHPNMITAGRDWSRIVVMNNPARPAMAGRDIQSVADEEQLDPFDVAYDTLLDNIDAGETVMVMIRCYTEAQQTEVFRHPLCMPGSDATTLAPVGPLAREVFHGAYTWAAWFFRYMTRTTSSFTPQEAIRRLTALPASRLGLRDRGQLKEGAHADLAIFDSDAFEQRGSVNHPNEIATGMRHVVVNGVLTLQDGELTGKRAGTVIRADRSNRS